MKMDTDVKEVGLNVACIVAFSCLKLRAWIHCETEKWKCHMFVLL